jgi:hypothetical protein
MAKFNLKKYLKEIAKNDHKPITDQYLKQILVLDIMQPFVKMEVTDIITYADGTQKATITLSHNIKDQII